MTPCKIKSDVIWATETNEREIISFGSLPSLNKQNFFKYSLHEMAQLLIFGQMTSAKFILIGRQ